MIERVDVGEIPLNGVFSIYRYFLAMNDKDFCVLYLFSIMNVLYSIEDYLWINRQVFIPWRRLAQRLGC